MCFGGVVLEGAQKGGDGSFSVGYFQFSASFSNLPTLPLISDIPYIKLSSV